MNTSKAGYTYYGSSNPVNYPLGLHFLYIIVKPVIEVAP